MIEFCGRKLLAFSRHYNINKISSVEASRGYVTLRSVRVSLFVCFVHLPVDWMTQKCMNGF